MFLLPAAERYRRVLFFVSSCLVLSLLALWRPAVLERGANAVVAPVTRVMAPLSGWATGMLMGPVEAAEVSAAGPGLVQVERLLGQPPAADRIVWLEVPVLGHQRGSGIVQLAAGSTSGLATGQPVAFGRQFLGRIAEVTEHQAELQLWTAAEVPTGLFLGAADSATNRGLGVCIGRGEGKSPLLQHMVEGSRPEAELPVFWRPQAEDGAPGLGGALFVGELFSQGDSSRGDATWQVRGELPPGAEGRVFVAVGAVAAASVAEPEVREASADWVLRADAVFGTDVCAARLASPQDGVVIQSDRVVGPVVARRGRTAWIYRRRPVEWGVDAVVADAEAGSIEFARKALQEGTGHQLYTRGGAGIPRGLWLGASGEPASLPMKGPLKVVEQAPFRPEDAQ